MYSKEAIDDAFNRIQDFAVLNFERDDEGKQEAIDLILLSLGVSEDVWAKIAKRAETFIPKGEQGAAMMGLMIGLLIAQSDK